MKFYIDDFELINSLGSNFQEIWTNIKHENQSIQKFSSSTTEYVAKIDYQILKQAKRDGVSTLGSLCIDVIDNMLKRTYVDMSKTCLVIGTCSGDLIEFERSQLLSDSPQKIYSEICEHFGIKNDQLTIGNACAAGQLAIDVACRKLFYDSEIDSAIVCSYDLIATTVFAGFKSINVLAPEFCRPFVVSDGMSLGEAVGCMLVKRDRGKFNICLSQINNDAYHLTSPEPTGKQKIELLESAKKLIGTKSVFVNIHGTGTAKNDISERNALTKVFPNIDVDVTKCFTGHCLGASGFAECMFVMQRLVEQPSYEYGISMNFAFSGTNSCIVLSKSNSHEFIANRHDSISISKSTYGHSRLSQIQIELGISDIKLRKCDDFSKNIVIAGIHVLQRHAAVDSCGCIVISDFVDNKTISSFSQCIMQNGISAASPFVFPNTVYNAAQGHLMKHANLHSYHLTVVSQNIDEICRLGKSLIATGELKSLMIIYSSSSKIEAYFIERQQND